MTNSISKSPHQSDLPGDFAIWIFIFAELLVFSIFFIAYAFARSYDVELFNASQSTLTREFGAINTVVLITSSFLWYAQLLRLKIIVPKFVSTGSVLHFLWVRFF